MRSVSSKTESRKAPRVARGRNSVDRKQAAVTLVGKAPPGKPSPGKAVLDKSPRRQQRLETKRTAILDAALELFAQYGLHGTTVDQIAEAADVSKTNLFYYFRTKEDVYVAALQTLLAEWLDPLLALNVEGDPIDSLSDYIRRKMEFSRKNPEASRLFCIEIVQGAPLLGKELRTSLKKLVTEKAQVIDAWIDAGKIAPRRSLPFDFLDLVDDAALCRLLGPGSRHRRKAAERQGILRRSGIERPAHHPQRHQNPHLQKSCLSFKEAERRRGWVPKSN